MRNIRDDANLIATKWRRAIAHAVDGVGTGALAERTGLSARTFRALAKAKTNPRLDTLAYLVLALGRPLSMLLDTPLPGLAGRLQSKADAFESDGVAPWLAVMPRVLRAKKIGKLAELIEVGNPGLFEAAQVGVQRREKNVYRWDIQWKFPRAHLEFEVTVTDERNANGEGSFTLVGSPVGTSVPRVKGLWGCWEIHCVGADEAPVHDVDFGFVLGIDCGSDESLRDAAELLRHELPTHMAKFATFVAYTIEGQPSNDTLHVAAADIRTKPKPRARRTKPRVRHTKPRVRRTKPRGRKSKPSVPT